MKNMLRIELHRAFINPNFYLAIVVGTLLISVFSIHYIISTPYRYYLLGIFEKHLFHDIYDYFCSYFFIFSPLLAVYPYSDSYVFDRMSGYNIFINLRIGRTSYLVSKVLANTLAGGMAILIPIVVSSLIFICSGYSEFYVAEGLGAWDEKYVFLNLLKQNPISAYLVFCLGSFLFGSAFATLALAISTLINDRYIVIILPVLLHFIYDSTIPPLFANFQGNPYFSNLLAINYSIYCSKTNWLSYFLPYICLFLISGYMINSHIRRNKDLL